LSAIQRLRVLELCAGIGGFGLSAEMVGGYEIVGQVEIDRFCQAVLAKHWPDVRRMGDIREVVGDEFGEIDLVCAGFPCQPNSMAGKRRGRTDERWLWPEIARVVRTAQPQWVVLENVPGLLSVDAGGGFADVLRDLAALGYRAGWGVWGAADVGAPHQRDRVFIVGYLADANSDRCGNGAHQSQLGAERRRPTNAGASGEGPDAIANTQSPEREWSGHTRSGRDGLADGGSDVADADRSGRGSHERHVHAGQPDAPGRGVGQADADCARLPQRDGRDAAQGPLAATCGDAEGAVESRLGRIADGLSGWLDGHWWPAGRGQAQFEWEAPRTVTKAQRVPNRAARLKALGNAIVPQQVAPLLAAIVKYEATA